MKASEIEVGKEYEIKSPHWRGGEIHVRVVERGLKAGSALTFHSEVAKREEGRTGVPARTGRNSFIRESGVRVELLEPVPASYGRGTDMEVGETFAVPNRDVLRAWGEEQEAQRAEVAARRAAREALAGRLVAAGLVDGFRVRDRAVEIECEAIEGWLDMLEERS